MSDDNRAISDDDIEHEIESLSRKVSSDTRATAVAAEKASRRATKSLASWPLAGLLVLIALALTVMNVMGIGHFRRTLPEPTPAERADWLQADLLAAVGYVEDYTTEHGRIPNSVQEMGLAGDEFAYEPLADGYLIVVERDGLRQEYDSRLAAVDSGAAQ